MLCVLPGWDRAAGAGQDASPVGKAVAPPRPGCPAGRARLPGLVHL